jgi:hypothetical protein
MAPACSTEASGTPPCPPPPLPTLFRPQGGPTPPPPPSTMTQKVAVCPSCSSAVVATVLAYVFMQPVVFSSHLTVFVIFYVSKIHNVFLYDFFLFKGSLCSSSIRRSSCWKARMAPGS